MKNDTKKMAFHLKLNKPCGALWENMQPQEKGRFCDQCSKLDTLCLVRRIEIDGFEVKQQAYIEGAMPNQYNCLRNLPCKL